MRGRSSLGVLADRKLDELDVPGTPPPEGRERGTDGRDGDVVYG
jgi:hypothetical protein